MRGLIRGVIAFLAVYASGALAGATASSPSMLAFIGAVILAVIGGHLIGNISAEADA